MKLNQTSQRPSRDSFASQHTSDAGNFDGFTKGTQLDNTLYKFNLV